VSQHPAAEEFPELVHDEPGEATAAGLRVDDGEELAYPCQVALDRAGDLLATFSSPSGSLES